MDTSAWPCPSVLLHTLGRKDQAEPVIAASSHQAGPVGPAALRASPPHYTCREVVQPGRTRRPAPAWTQGASSPHAELSP